MTTTGPAPTAVGEDDATRLSTQPLPVEPLLPARPGSRAQPFAPLRRAWRQLTSMRTALLLLFLLALAAVPGGFLPQRRINPARVQSYLAEHRTLGPLLDRLSLFSVFGSAWFAAIYLLLFVSLVGCLFPRIRLHARALRLPPPRVPAALGRLPVSDRWVTALPAEQVLEQARASLRRRRWRVVRRGDALSAEKGYLRETGNLLFHVSLVLLLVGIAIGAFSGFKGTVLVTEGRGFSNAIALYDDVNPGRRFDPGSLVPFTVSLQDFAATYTRDGKALTFDARVRWAQRPGAPERSYDIRVNHPLHLGAAKVYLVGHGYAPVVRVTDARGRSVQQAVPCLPQTPQFLSNCTIKAPDAGPRQLGFKGVFSPTTVVDATGHIGSSGPAPERPALTLVGYAGDLGVDAGLPQSVYELDTTAMQPLDGGRAHALAPGQTFAVPGQGSITYVGTREWVTFQVTQDPGKPLALAAACGMVLGLLLSLFVRRRRLWLRVLPAGGGGGGGHTVVETGGLARTDPDAFEGEFAELGGQLRERAAPPLAPEARSERV